MTKSTGNRIYQENISLPRERTPEKPNLDGDRLNVFLLTTLYTIQGFLIGFSISLPIILQSNQNVTYEDQVSFYFINLMKYVNIINCTIKIKISLLLGRDNGDGSYLRLVNDTCRVILFLI